MAGVSPTAAGVRIRSQTWIRKMSSLLQISQIPQKQLLLYTAKAHLSEYCIK